MANSTNDGNEKLRQYDALTPVQDERPNERDPFMGHASCFTSPNKKRALDTDNPIQSAPHVQESTCNLTKIFIKAENCAIYLNGKDQPTWIILDGKVLS